MPSRYKEFTYVIYKTGSDVPLVVDKPAKECAEVMGITPEAFRSLLTNISLEISKQWKIYKSVNGVYRERNVPHEYINTQRLTKIDLDIIRIMHEDGVVKNSRLGRMLYVDSNTILYHKRKIERLTDLNPMIPEDLKLLWGRYINDDQNT